MRHSLEGLLATCTPDRFVDQNALVIIRWLKSRPELNDKTANVVRYCAKTGRFGVRVEGETLFIKPTNLLLEKEDDDEPYYDDDDYGNVPLQQGAPMASGDDDVDDAVVQKPWVPPSTQPPPPRPIPVALANAPSAPRAFSVDKFDKLVSEDERREKAEADERYQKEQKKFVDEKLTPMLMPTQEGLNDFLKAEARKDAGR